jgi:hypothetical protein
MNKTTRRGFIGNTTRVAVAGTFLSTINIPQQREMKNIFVHHVYFWLKDAGSKTDLDKLIAGLKKLSAVKTIKQFHIGKPAATKREVIDSSYAVSWLALFDNKEDQDSYQTDPIHLKFVEECSALWEKVIVYDAVNM